MLVVPISGTCLDLLFSSHTDLIKKVMRKNISLLDHLPVFGARFFKGCNIFQKKHHNHYITFRDIKNLNKDCFNDTIDNIDVILDTWLQLLIQLLICPNEI